MITYRMYKKGGAYTHSEHGKYYLIQIEDDLRTGRTVRFPKK